jgi:hypothetical protein
MIAFLKVKKNYLSSNKNLDINRNTTLFIISLDAQLIFHKLYK